MIWIPNRGKRSSQHSNLSFFSFSPNPFWRNFDFHILLDFNLTTESGISESSGDTVMPVCRSRIRVHHENSAGCAQPVSPAIDFVVERWIRTHSLFNQNLSEILSYWKQEIIPHPIFPYRQFDLLTHIFHHPNQISFTFLNTIRFWFLGDSISKNFLVRDPRWTWRPDISGNQRDSPSSKNLHTFQIVIFAQLNFFRSAWLGSRSSFNGAGLIHWFKREVIKSSLYLNDLSNYVWK